MRLSAFLHPAHLRVKAKDWEREREWKRERERQTAREWKGGRERERKKERELGGKAERLTETERERFPTKTSKSTHCSMVWVLVSKVSCMMRQAEASMPPCCIQPPLSCTPTPRPVVHDRLNRLSASPAKNSGYNKLKTRLRKDLLEVWGSNIAQSVICERERREKKLNMCAAAELTRSREAGV